MRGFGYSMRLMKLVSALGLGLLVGSFVAACGGSSDDSKDNPSSGGAGASAGAGGSGGLAGGATGGTAGGGAGAPGGTGGGPTGPKASECFADIYDGPITVDYDQYNPSIGSHCLGTNHQDIQGVEKLVFLGDSITVGTVPTPGNSVYRALLTAELTQKFPGLEVQNCAKNGADLGNLAGQFAQCFPSGGDNKKTLIVFTMGGNDLVPMAKSKLSAADGIKAADGLLATLEAQVKAYKDPAKFPNGSFVMFANVYEYTDATTEMTSCPSATFAGLTGTWPDGLAVFKHLREGYLKIAVETKSDMIFMGEEFCGHGFRASKADGQCYRGPNSETWFDLTCIHPNPAGHAEIAAMFSAVVAE